MTDSTALADEWEKKVRTFALIYDEAVQAREELEEKVACLLKRIREL